MSSRRSVSCQSFSCLGRCGPLVFGCCFVDFLLFGDWSLCLFVCLLIFVPNFAFPYMRSSGISQIHIKFLKWMLFGSFGLLCAITGHESCSGRGPGNPSGLHGLCKLCHCHRVVPLCSQKDCELLQPSEILTSWSHQSTDFRRTCDGHAHVSPHDRYRTRGHRGGTRGTHPTVGSRDRL